MIVELNPPIVFHRWMPDQQDAIEDQANGIELAIWFDLDCTSWPRTREEIEQLFNVGATKVHVTARSNVSDALKAHIEANLPGSETTAPGQEYQALARAIHRLTTDRLKRLVEYAYAVKGQFWLGDMHFDEVNPSQFFIKAHAQASFEDGRTHRFDPHNMLILTGYMHEPKTLIAADEWENVKAFVLGEERSPMVGRLLASARELASKGHNRTALIEAVCALEIKLGELARKRDEDLIPEHVEIRLETVGLASLIERIGLRGAFATVLPLILDEQQLPSEIVTRCRRALDVRGTVVHSGQRNIQDHLLLQMLAAIEECCSRFDQLIASRE